MEYVYYHDGKVTPCNEKMIWRCVVHSCFFPSMTLSEVSSAVVCQLAKKLFLFYLDALNNNVVLKYTVICEKKVSYWVCLKQYLGYRSRSLFCVFVVRFRSFSLNWRALE